jgi:hypothetical protein
MSKNNRFDEVSQQLVLLEQGVKGWKIPQRLIQSASNAIPLSTKEVMKVLPLESPTLLYRARRERAAYWHKTADVSQSKIVVPLGMRDKWVVFTPQSS